MRAYVVGVVRGAARLELLTYEARDPDDRARPWSRSHVCEQRPLPTTSRVELWTAWHALASVTTWDDATLNHVLTVLRETVPSTEPAGALRALGPDVHPPPPPRPTAAHPRAYRGTRHRPPRPQRPEPVDVRPYLLERRYIDQVLAHLGHDRGIDPYVAWHFRTDTTASFDASFVMQLLPLFRGCTWSQVGTFASLARTLELDRDPALRAALVGVFIGAAEPARAIGWWSHVLAHPPGRRLETAQLVVATGAAARDPIDPVVAAELAALDPTRQWSLYRGFARGASPAYLVSGLELDAISPTQVEDVAPGHHDVTAIVTATVERLDRAMDEDSGPGFWRRHLWSLCGDQPEMIDLLALPAFVSLEPRAAFWLIRLANSPQWSPETAAREWCALGPELPRLATTAAGLPREYQRKFIEDMADVYWWSGHRHDVTALARAGDLGLRVARPPFGTRAALGSVLPRLVQWADRDTLRALRDAPDASWLALETACQRDNDARIVGRGLGRLAHLAPALLATSFASSPGAVLQTADLLAAVSLEAAEQLITAYRASPIAEAGVADAPVERLCALIEPIARAGGPNPVRRALRRHVLGEVSLSQTQLRGHRERIVADLDVVRLAAIRQAVERILAARVGIERIESSTVRHALTMLGSVESHRRQLRRMLAANLGGDREWRLRHPRTQEWFARHPRIDRDTWLAGVEIGGEIDGVGAVRLAIETDPLEALKLGTYVGSCLGRGGSFAYSAAAVVLDVNKQVIYARDSRGSVVGRQLVAISEDDQLVCYSVYGTVTSELLEPLFRRFDHAFAAALALPLLGPRSSSEDGYEIASILSHDWWDDSAWTDVVSR